MTKVVSADQLGDYIGKEVGVTDWFEIDQQRINQFADATGDHQYIHVDPERAAQTPFGTTIAHGFLTLSLFLTLSFSFSHFLSLRPLSLARRPSLACVRVPCSNLSHFPQENKKK